MELSRKLSDCVYDTGERREVRKQNWAETALECDVHVTGLSQYSGRCSAKGDGQLPALLRAEYVLSRMGI